MKLSIEYLITSTIITLTILILFIAHAHAESIPSPETVCQAIFWAEGGTHTIHPYGILTKYKKTTPKQACINTIKHFNRDWNGKGDYIEKLAERYCPIDSDTDNETCKYWPKNVKYFIKKGK